MQIFTCLLQTEKLVSGKLLQHDVLQPMYQQRFILIWQWVRNGAMHMQVLLRILLCQNWGAVTGGAGYGSHTILSCKPVSSLQQC